MEADNPSPDVSWLSLILGLILDWTIELMVASSNNARLDTKQCTQYGVDIEQCGTIPFQGWF